MSRSGSASARKRATGTCRDPRRASRGQRPGWVRPVRRVHSALNASLRLIDTVLRTLAVCERRAVRRPIGTSRSLDHASGVLVTASAQLARAVKGLAEANEWIALHPEDAAGAPEVLVKATERWLSVIQFLEGVSNQVFGLHEDVLEGLEAGELVPEPPPQPRRRIVLVPRPAQVGAFLRTRLRRAVDRISPVLQRRRRTRRPASLRVPRRTSQGRAPPLVPVCLL